MMNNYETKKKIVMEGGSKVFQSWQSLLPNLTEEMFCEALKWVCEDKESGMLTREIGLTQIGIAKLYRHNELGLTRFRYEDGRIWAGDFFRVSCANKAFADEDGMISQNIKLSISARDRV